ncbi:MAG TPA: hypothetical protein VFZ66_18750 [Herpetosiphonaceae bacterium]
MPPVPPESPFVLLDVARLFNWDSISYASNLRDGTFNVWQNSFPAEELPESHSIVEVAGVPFRFPPKEAGHLNNIRCSGERLDLPSDRYDWVYILAASERRAEDIVYLHFTSGAIEMEWLRISDFWPGGPQRFGEVEAFRCKHMHFPRHIQSGQEPVMWMQRIPVTRQEPLAWLRLPQNIAIHIFAATALKTPEGLVQ